jgi:hypothetical protein
MWGNHNKARRGTNGFAAKSTRDRHTVLSDCPWFSDGGEKSYLGPPEPESSSCALAACDGGNTSQTGNGRGEEYSSSESLYVKEKATVAESGTKGLGDW